MCGRASFLLLNPSWERILSSIIRGIIMRIFIRPIFLILYCTRAILCVDIHLFFIPQHDLIPCISCQIDDLCTEFRMSVIWEEYDSISFPIQHSAPTDASIQQNQFCPVTHPVDRSNDISVAGGFLMPRSPHPCSHRDKGFPDCPNRSSYRFPFLAALDNSFRY